jgi:hypothetical protein
MKLKRWIFAAPVVVVLVLGLSGVALAKGNGDAPANNAHISGATVIAWNQELLHIVQTPGAQPATIQPTRNFAILHAAIYDAVVSITHDAQPYVVSVRAPRGARADAAAAQAGHDALAVLYPSFKTELDNVLAGQLAAIPNGNSK